MEERNEMKGKTYCVTGATGYIGSWLVKSLLERGYRVHATFRSPGKLFIHPLPPNPPSPPLSPMLLSID